MAAPRRFCARETQVIQVTQAFQEAQAPPELPELPVFSAPRCGRAYFWRRSVRRVRRTRSCSETEAGASWT